jgi:PAS domain S-box-containing protein
MVKDSITYLQSEIADLRERLAESEQLIDAIKAGEVDAFAIQTDVYTLQSGDYAYRVLVEEFGEGALNVTEEGLIVYTNTYFCELMGLPYEKVIGSSLEDLIHSGSKSYYQELLEASLTGQCKGEINLFSGGRMIPVYISLTSLQPKLESVGIIITDLTEKKQKDLVIQNYQRDLEANNLALTQSNAELASFAYIASHDLQEPLRKIQLFSNLILEKDADRFSPRARDYFNRMVEAARRMQRLIIALLDYSRITTVETPYLLTDLNGIAGEVGDNLQAILEETGALIDVAGLPTLRVIPHQFVQLFSNIILNAIKYRKPGFAPIIVISASKWPVGDLHLPANFKCPHYWEIRIKDNGIGFDQQYAGRIFELFQRLSNAPEVDGTGIGLSICHKIMQNHGGYITAEGSVGEGATFVLYLPASLE